MWNLPFLSDAAEAFRGNAVQSHRKPIPRKPQCLYRGGYYKLPEIWRTSRCSAHPLPIVRSERNARAICGKLRTVWKRIIHSTCLNKPNYSAKDAQCQRDSASDRGLKCHLRHFVLGLSPLRPPCPDATDYIQIIPMRDYPQEKRIIPLCNLI